LHIGKTPVEYDRPKILLLTQLDALLHGARLVPSVGMREADIALAHDVAMRFPWTATQNRYALTLALNNHSDEARRQLAVMRVMHGEETHRKIMENWENLSESKFPQLKTYLMPKNSWKK
jgi:hypothetical protein